MATKEKKSKVKDEIKPQLEALPTEEKNSVPNPINFNVKENEKEDAKNP